MREITATLPSGRLIRGSEWVPRGEPSAAVVIVHGIGEHVGRYERLTSAWSARGWCSVGFDHLGHGRTHGARGHVPHFGWLLDEIDLAVARAGELAPSRPLFLYGHSWGGNILASWLLEHRASFDGAVLSSPWLRLGHPPAAWRVGLAKLLNPVLPGLGQKTDIPADHLTRDPREVEAYLADPLVHHRITLRTFVESAASSERVMNHAAELPGPLLVIQGRDDEVCDPEGARALAKANDRIVLREYQGRHELHHELNAETVIQETVEWMAKTSGV
ncbi:MAG: alpha/beta hydrolase [Planctomycetota bacterium]